jgi:hypothetical protein
MKALVYHGPGAKAWEEVPMPELDADTDAMGRRRHDLRYRPSHSQGRRTCRNARPYPWARGGGYGPVGRFRGAFG